MNHSEPERSDREHMQAITISREYGSGGGEIARRLAGRLNWKLFDHEAVLLVARQLGISLAEAEKQDEHAESLGMRLLNSLSVVQPTMPTALPAMPVQHERAYHAAMHKVVETAITGGHIVVVGRGSQVLLRQRRDVLHVRIIAPLEQRITYVMRRERLSHEDAQARIRYKDSGRVRYLQTQHHCNPADPLLYDLVINTAVLDLESALDLILLTLERKARRLHVPASELGPGATLRQYSSHPEDFHIIHRLED